MSLSEAARIARETASASISRGDHALANALEAALDAEARRLVTSLEDEPDVSGIQPWSQDGATG